MAAISKVLIGHTSEATAHVTEDYPYGFILRCVRKEWLEYKPTKGYRFVTMTSNPKRVAFTWNKPKASVYADLAVLYMDEHEHVQWATLHMNATEPEIDAFVTLYGAALGPQEQKIVGFLRAIAQETERRRAQYNYSIQGSTPVRVA